MRRFGFLKVFIFLVVFSIPFVITSCGGGGGGSTGSTTTTINGQATLGPLSGSAVVLTDLSNRVIASTVSQSDNTSLSNAGSFSFSIENSKLPNIFLLKACGGEDIDPSDNNTVSSSVNNNGCIHAILTSDDLYGRRIEINPLTEIIYQDALNTYGANLSSISEADLKTFLNKEAQLYLKNTDATYNDILTFNPMVDKSKSRINWSRVLSLLVSGIHNGESSNMIAQRVIVLKSWLKKNGVYVSNDNESIKQIKNDANGNRFITSIAKSDDNSSVGALRQILVTKSGEIINIYVSKVNNTDSYLSATITKQGHTLSIQGKTTLLQGLDFNKNTIANFIEPLVQITSDNSSSVQIKISKKLAEKISNHELVFKIDGREPTTEELKVLVDDPIVIWDTKATEEEGLKYAEYNFIKNNQPFTLRIYPGTGVAVLELNENYYDKLMGITHYSDEISLKNIKDTALTLLGVIKDDKVLEGVEGVIDKSDLPGGLGVLSKFFGLISVAGDLNFIASGGISKAAIKLGAAHTITYLMGIQNESTIYSNKPYYPIIFFKPQQYTQGRTIYLNIKEVQMEEPLNNSVLVPSSMPYYMPLESYQTIALCNLKPKLNKVYIIFPGKIIFKKKFRDRIIYDYIYHKPVGKMVTYVTLNATNGIQSGIIKKSNTYKLENAKTIYTNFTYSVKNNQLYLDASSSIAPDGSIESYIWKNSLGETIATGKTATISFSDLIVTIGLTSITLETKSGNYTGERTKIISLCGDNEIYENGACVSNSLSSIILSENFSQGFSNWTLFGSPSPKIVSSFKNHSYVFDNNGDSWCDSGIFSNTSFDLQPGIEIDADIYLEVNNYNGCWNTIRIALTKGVPQTSGSCVGESYYYYNLFIFNMEGQACWADNPNLYNHSYIQLPPDFKRILADKYVNGWHHLKIVINSDYTETVYIDNTKIGTSSSPIPEDYRSNVKLMLAGRSSGYGGKSYMDNVVISFNGQ